MSCASCGGGGGTVALGSCPQATVGDRAPPMSMWSLRGPAPGRILPSLPAPRRTPLPALDKGSPFLPRGSHPKTALPHECESRPACRKPPRRPLLPRPRLPIDGTGSSAAWTAHCTGGGQGSGQAWAAHEETDISYSPAKAGGMAGELQSPAPPQHSLALHRCGAPTGQ